MIVDHQLRLIVSDLDSLIRRCDLLTLHEVSARLQPIRDIIQQGIELRALAKSQPGYDDTARGGGKP